MQNSDKTTRFGRLDLIFEKAKLDEETRTAYFSAKPDPRRYECVTIENSVFYRDKYLRTLVSMDSIHQQIAGLPIHRLNPTIESAEHYADLRQTAISCHLSGGDYAEPEGVKGKHKPLELTKQKNLTFISVDICKSTSYRAADPESYEKAYPIIINELGAAVAHFSGCIYKTTGDGFIAYIDFPAFTNQCDATIDLGLTLIKLMYSAINPALENINIKKMDIRVGADFGPAEMRPVSIKSIGYHATEVASDALNRAVKIEQSCAPGEFRIGRNLYELIHVQWLERAQQVNLPLALSDANEYLIYIVQ